MPIGIECSAGLMQEVTCFHCRTVVQIAPDDDHCSNCGEDLRGLLDAQHVSDFFCAPRRGTERSRSTGRRAGRGRARTVVPRHGGVASAGGHAGGGAGALRLSCASHVAAIPLDDSLRPEAEWLLRSHQERQRALREGARHGRPGLPPSAGLRLSGRRARHACGGASVPAQSLHAMWMGAAAVLMVTLLLMTVVCTRTSALRASPVQPRRDQDQAVAGEAVPEQPVEAEAPCKRRRRRRRRTSDARRGEPAPSRTSRDGRAHARLSVCCPFPRRRCLRTWCCRPAEGEAIVDSNPRSVVVLSADGFDLARVLRERGLSLNWPSCPSTPACRTASWSSTASCIWTCSGGRSWRRWRLCPASPR